jgi:hypothetical protein
MHAGTFGRKGTGPSLMERALLSIGLSISRVVRWTSVGNHTSKKNTRLLDPPIPENKICAWFDGAAQPVDNQCGAGASLK